MSKMLDDVDRAIKDIADGRPVLVVDDENRENEGDIIFAAAMATPELLAFTIRYTSGVICMPMREAELDRLQLPQMTSHNTEPSPFAPLSSRSTYLAITSTSRFTVSPGSLMPSVVRFSVSGMRQTSNQPAASTASLRAETVRLIPSTAIDPFSTT